MMIGVTQYQLDIDIGSHQIESDHVEQKLVGFFSENIAIEDI